jgi:hypothetical protein
MPSQNRPGRSIGRDVRFSPRAVAGGACRHTTAHAGGAVGRLRWPCRAQAGDSDVRGARTIRFADRGRLAEGSHDTLTV